MNFEFDKNVFRKLLSKQGAVLLDRVLNDSEIREIYQIGDLMSRIELETPHDYSHALRAMCICAELIKLVQGTNLRAEVYKLLDKESMNLALLIASYMHDIGNFVNREEHALAGAIIGFNILNKYF
ncbi:MAG: hypothetical protein QW739_02555, partial [Candidatus Odinarchaeota archaeon]